MVTNQAVLSPEIQSDRKGTPQFFTTTIVHTEDHDLRWHFVAAPRRLLREFDLFEDSPEIILSRSSVPFVIALMILQDDALQSFALADATDLADQLETRFKILPYTNYPRRETLALELAENIVFNSRVAFDDGESISPLSLINPDHSRISLVAKGKNRFLVIIGPKGVLIGAAGAITIIEKIWEALIDLM